ncbi:MAG: radical SAM protein [Deltaproteobacteria bacterium]|nr:radical SAM protein [Deltaproteobacteria bacterium]
MQPCHSEQRLARRAEIELPNEKEILFLVSPIGTLWRSFPYIETPFGASLVVSNLRKQGWNVTFVDLDLQLNSWQKKKIFLSRQTLSLLEDWPQLLEQLDRIPQDLKELLQYMVDFIQQYRFRYVALSLGRLSKKPKVYDVEFGFALALAWFIKSSYPYPVIFGGQILSKIGRKVIEKPIAKTSQRCADFLFYGDGAVSLPILLQALQDRMDFTELVEHLQKSNALITWWQEGGKTVTLGNGGTPPVRHTDAGPKYNLERDLLEVRPSFEITNASLYSVNVKQIFRGPTREPWTIRPIFIFPYKFMYGCSHRCAFCKTAYQPLIFKPVAKVVDDLQYYIEKEGVRCFRFFNSQINFKRRYVEEFCNEVVQRNLKFYFTDSACLRNMDKEICDMLRQAGCVKLWFGIESPVEKILKLINKQLALNEALIAIERAHQAGIWIGANLILGFPHESDEDFEQVCDFVENYREIVDCWNFSFLQVYEETPMYNHPADYGIQIHNRYSGSMRDKGFAFSEINGLDWETRSQMALKRVEHCNQLVGAAENHFRSNDYLLFALYQEFDEKNLVRSHLRSFIEEMERSINLADGAKWITPNKVTGFDSGSFLQWLEDLP